MPDVQRVLVIGPSNIGDAILASEVIAALHTAFPQAHMTLVIGARAKPLFVEDPRIRTVVDADAFDSARGRLSLALALWRYQPHVVVDLRHTLYPMLLKPLSLWRYLQQPPRTIAHMRNRHLWKLHHQVPTVVAPAANDPAIAPRPSAVGGTPVGLHSPIWFSPRDAAQVDALWRRWSLERTARLVIICPGARSHIKRWIAEGFAQVADRLIAEAGAEVIFSGEPDEEPIITAVLEAMEQRAYSAVGLTTIRQLGLLMRRARLVITNDSASMHLASALGVPTVAIFGPTDEAKYGPRSMPSRTVRRRLFCAPCEQALCRFNHECMRFIGPDEVYRAARELLDHA